MCIWLQKTASLWHNHVRCLRCLSRKHTKTSLVDSLCPRCKATGKLGVQLFLFFKENQALADPWPSPLTVAHLSEGLILHSGLETVMDSITAIREWFWHWCVHLASTLQKPARPIWLLGFNRILPDNTVTLAYIIWQGSARFCCNSTFIFLHL